MPVNRRRFLKYAGATAAVVGASALGLNYLVKSPSNGLNQTTTTTIVSSNSSISSSSVTSTSAANQTSGSTGLIFSDDFESGSLGYWQFHFGEYETGKNGELGYAVLTNDSHEVIDGRYSLEVISHPLAYSNSIAFHDLAFASAALLRLDTEWKVLDGNLDSIEFAINLFDGTTRFEGALQHLIWPRSRWRYWSNDLQWKDLDLSEDILTGRVNKLALTVDFRNKRYVGMSNNRTHLDFGLPIAESPGPWISDTRIHFEHRPVNNDRSKVVYDNIVLTSL